MLNDDPVSDRTVYKRRYDDIIYQNISCQKEEILKITEVVFCIDKRLTKLEEHMTCSESMIADKAAHTAVIEVFNRIGVDINDPAELSKFRDNLYLGKTVRDIAQKSVWSLMTAVAGIVATVIWIIVSNKLKNSL